MPAKKKTDPGPVRDLKTAGDITGILERLPPAVPVEVEIGCGNGHFIAEYAVKKSAIHLVGIEIKKKRCLRILKKLSAGKITNVDVIAGMAEVAIGALPPASVDRFHLYFPDPWPKNRHRKRRFLRRENLERLVESLKPGGTIYFATDFFDYALQAKVLFLLNEHLTIITEQPPEEAFLSVYASRFLNARKPIRFIAAEKVK